MQGGFLTAQFIFSNYYANMFLWFSFLMLIEGFFYLKQRPDFLIPNNITDSEICLHEDKNK